jgi:hypothetical protein
VAIQEQQPFDVPVSWRAEVAARARELEGRLDVAAAARGAADDDPRRGKQVDAVRSLLRDAEDAIAKPLPRWQRIKSWWTGATVDFAWDSIHHAEVGLAGIADQGELFGAVTPLRRWLRLVLPRPQAEAWEKRFELWEKAEDVDRDVLRQAYGDAITANRDWHSSLRAFRNLILCVAAGLAFLLVVLSGWHLLNTSILPLCAFREDAAGCFGGSSPGKTVIEVELVGMLGGLLGSAFLIAKLKDPPSRYNVLLPQIVLKAVAGAATALVGVLFVQSDLVLSPPRDDHSTIVLLTYAITFGFSQQLLTQLIDRHSATLLGPPKARDAEAV